KSAEFLRSWFGVPFAFTIVSTSHACVETMVKAKGTDHSSGLGKCRGVHMKWPPPGLPFVEPELRPPPLKSRVSALVLRDVPFERVTRGSLLAERQHVMAGLSLRIAGDFIFTKSPPA
ncbi:MAG: hypothetical protein KDA96_16855, partial [Planctomycetaceae bacterium]|nr:hypothetical protein [Planctomycetaceae bacterium]